MLLAEISGVYSSVLSGVGYGIVVTFTTLTILFSLFCASVCRHRSGKESWWTFALFVFATSVISLHLFGDQRVLGWAYQSHVPDVAVENAVATNLWFVPFGVVFWLLILSEVPVLIYSIRSKNGGYGVLSIVVVLGLIQFLTGIPVFQTIWDNPLIASGGAVSWLTLGVFWTLKKWDSHAKNHRIRYDVKRAEWCVQRNIDPAIPHSQLTLAQRAAWEQHFFSGGNWDDEGPIEFQPRYRDHKSEIMGWLILWPLSVAEYFLFDLIAEIFNEIWHRIGGMLQAIMLRRWVGTEGTLLTPEEKAQLQADRENQ